MIQTDHEPNTPIEPKLHLAELGRDSVETELPEGTTEAATVQEIPVEQHIGRTMLQEVGRTRQNIPLIRF